MLRWPLFHFFCFFYLFIIIIIIRSMLRRERISLSAERQVDDEYINQSIIFLFERLIIQFIQLRIDRKPLGNGSLWQLSWGYWSWAWPIQNVRCASGLTYWKGWKRNQSFNRLMAFFLGLRECFRSNLFISRQTSKKCPQFDIAECFTDKLSYCITAV